MHSGFVQIFVTRKRMAKQHIPRTLVWPKGLWHFSSVPPICSRPFPFLVFPNVFLHGLANAHWITLRVLLWPLRTKFAWRFPWRPNNIRITRVVPQYSLPSAWPLPTTGLKHTKALLRHMRTNSDAALIVSIETRTLTLIIYGWLQYATVLNTPHRTPTNKTRQRNTSGENLFFFNQLIIQLCAFTNGAETIPTCLAWA